MQCWVSFRSISYKCIDQLHCIYLGFLRQNSQKVMQHRIHYRIPLFFLQICECGKTHCKTCEAEREAQRSAISWMNQPSHVDEQKESKKANQQHHFEMSENCTKAGIECKESGDELKSNTQRNMPEHCGDLEKENTYSKKSHISSDEENENDYTFYKVEFDEEEYNSQKRKDSHSDVKNTKVMTGGNSSFSDDFSPQSSGEMTRMEQARQGQKFLVFLSGNIPPNFTVRCVIYFQCILEKYIV